ncbi:hypothetical protein NEUTE1DRAFT_131047 [Neurospora tetrasperma FGSC 2508]|uniref:Uncharacterized protein n=1 Tax=Neurospora tetrasperma (strain FGSC 2508 / ATCC MYA-4615 / P0657) TaxID=510951 RepID=F8MT96_NEUT8|nr:uncharacterized protein NEUTE1DRAFT_131047 [Neurospora tetrasperma FGSC 2508]EGO55228.1 hypothetical protein NEUTE1DRAFT_131047 [Neurospora tetrasperma FGSC 2508]EGZ69554.1 hypothetical protein NEUTE2DRAFT_116200 [Neurospora tetrasperma FGSC 2509]
MTKATLWFWLAVVLTGVRAQWIELTFPKFKNEATKERAEYWEGDILIVAWVIEQDTAIKEVDLYCTRSNDGIRWGRYMEYGASENLGDRGVDGWKTGQAYDTLGNAQNVNKPLITNHWVFNETQVYPLPSLPMYDLAETIECAFAGYGTDGRSSNQTLIGYGYPFKFRNVARQKPITTPFGVDGGPIDADDISNASSSTISTQVTSATGISTTGLPQNNPTATESADGPNLTATSTSSGTVLPTGPATGIESGTAESPGAKDRGGLSTGAIAGIAASSATLGIVMAALAFWVFWRRRKSQLTAAAAAATASASTANSTSPGGGGGGGEGEGETQEKGAMTTYFKAELEDSPRPCRNELDGTWKGAEVKEKARMSELGAVEQQRHEIDGGGDWHNRFELA